MKKLIVCLVLLWAATPAKAQTDGWVLFAKTKFEAKYNEAAKEYFLYPSFPTDLKSQEGKELTLEGYHLPLDIEGDKYIILSKYPFAQCFFCGGAGPESIAEVYFKVKQAKFEADQYIRVKGKLRLNDKDVEHGNFILEEAVLINK
ncbi:MAG: hypothetical protein MUC38_13385 [Cyclobacteriaceae bacterium]|nr:hypothetical protein [Cyclobacteriaceae bacterium]